MTCAVIVWGSLKKGRVVFTLALLSHWPMPSQESMSVSQTPYRYIVLKSSFIYIWPFVPFLFSPPFFSCFYLILVPVTYACFSLSLLLYFIWKKKGDLSINVTLFFQAKPTLVNFLRKSSLTKKAKNYFTKIALWTQIMYH